MHFYVLCSCTVPSLPSELAEDILILICRMIMAISIAALMMSLAPQLNAFFGCGESKLIEVSDGHMGCLTEGAARSGIRKLLYLRNWRLGGLCSVLLGLFCV